MSFSDVRLAAWTAVLTGPFSTTVEYKSRPDTGAEADWVTGVPAQVDVGDRANSQEWPTVQRMGELPIYVTILKTSITNLRVGRDHIRYMNVVYVVKGVVLDDGVVLELYCAR